MKEGVSGAVKPVTVERDDHLQTIEDRIMAEIPEDVQNDLERVVVSARQIIYDKKTHKQVFNGMRDIDEANDARKVALGVTAILTIVNRESNGKIPVELYVPAGVLVAVDVIRFMVDSGMVEDSTEFTGNVVEEWLAAAMQKMGMGKSKPPAAAQIPPQGTAQAPQGGLVGAPL